MSDQKTDDDFDIDKYFDESEPEEHWELRRKFLLANKGKCPEPYLIALSRVFTNVEFMGCSYNKEVMQKVALMSEGIVESYRQNKKLKLQRTFVKASDAAESRYTGNKQPHSTIGTKEGTSNSTDKNYSTASESSSTESQNYDKLLEKVRSQPGFRGQLVIQTNLVDLNPWAIIHRCIVGQIKGITPWIEKLSEPTVNGKQKFKLYIGQEEICTEYAINEKDAKLVLGKIALEKLQTTCFTLERKQALTESGETVEKEEINAEGTSESLLKSDNVGLKLMKMMGWGGKGLGKNEHGREDNVEVSDCVTRRGLGFSSDNPQDNKKVRAKLENILREYIASGNTKNLVFSSDFTNEERKFIHQKARRYNLKTRSYGKRGKDDRRLVLSRNFTNWEIVERLLKCGLSDELHTLKLPSSFL